MWSARSLARASRCTEPDSVPEPAGGAAANAPGPLREFLRMRPGRELALVLVLKLVALYALWAAFFSHPAVPDGEAVARAVMPPASASPAKGNER